MGSEPGHDAGKAAPPPAEVGALMRQAMAFHRAGMLAEAVSAAEIPARATDDYIRNLFAPFASAFDGVLAKLNYRVPGLLAALRARFPTDRPLDVADAGCGTGLCAPALRPLARRLVGVDLSPEMLEKARARGLYDALGRPS